MTQTGSVLIHGLLLAGKPLYMIPFWEGDREEHLFSGHTIRTDITHMAVISLDEAGSLNSLCTFANL